MRISKSIVIFAGALLVVTAVDTAFGANTNSKTGKVGAANKSMETMAPDVKVETPVAQRIAPGRKAGIGHPSCVFARRPAMGRYVKSHRGPCGGARSRRAVNDSFGGILATGTKKEADVALGAGASLAPFVPGGAANSAAISNVRGAVGVGGGPQSAMSTQMGSAAPNASSLTGGSVVGGGGSPGGAMGQVNQMAAGGDKDATMMSAMAQMHEMNQSFSMQSLMMQQKIQQETREFNLMSNVMKTKHEAAKNAVNNIR